MEALKEIDPVIGEFLEDCDEVLFRLAHVFDNSGLHPRDAQHEYLSTEPEIFEQIFGTYVSETKAFAQGIARAILANPEKAEEFLREVEMRLDADMRGAHVAELLNTWISVHVARYLVQYDAGAAGRNPAAFACYLRTEETVTPEIISQVLGSGEAANNVIVTSLVSRQMEEIYSGQDLSGTGRMASAMFEQREKIAETWRAAALEITSSQVS